MYVLVNNRADGNAPSTVQAGVNPDVARQISGHRTPAIFSRYNIISESDLRQAVRQTSEYLATLPTKSNVLVLKVVAE